MSPDQEQPRNVPPADHAGIMQSLVAHYWAKDQTLQQLQARLAERERELTLSFINSRSYRYAIRLAQVYRCLRHPRQGVPLIKRKLQSLRPGQRFRRLAGAG